MQQLSWQQVNTWRLAQQQLLERAEPVHLLEVVTRLGGVQAQLMSAAELALWARVKAITPAAVQKLLWDERSLLKTWAMRGTLHLLPATELGRFVAACTATPIRRPPSYYTYHKVAPAELDAILATVPTVLSATPITREQLADAVVERTGNPNLREVLLSGWGALLKPSARRGDICFGPNQGQNVTFVHPSAWLRQPVATEEPALALPAILRRFLTTYGPATPDEFARWWGTDESQARKLWKSMANELTEVEVEGWRAWVLPTTLAEMQSQPATTTVRLLPFFDPYTLAVARHSDYLLLAAHKAQVYRAQGWIAPVVLVDGHIAGIWEHEIKRNEVLVSVTLFAAPAPPISAAITAEVENLGQFLGYSAQLQIRA
jgi:uncharacterized protein YcaQ